GAFVDYALCAGQQAAPTLGYSPLPINLVQAGLAQVKKIPGAVVKNINIQTCHNPTFSTTGANTLAVDALYPDLCDKRGASVTCAYGTPVRGSKSASGAGQGDNNVVGNHSSGTTSGGGSASPITSNSPGGSSVPGGGTAGSNATGSGGGGVRWLPNPDGKTSCDQDTGQCTTLGATPVQVAANVDSGFSEIAVWIALAGLFLLIVAPPAVVLLNRNKH
ncbi:MAG: hypothetical protein ACTHOG_11460, partial [Marmoricola sp.]